MLINLNTPYKTIEKSVSDGFFDVNYLKSRSSLYIDNNQGLFIGLASGHILKLTQVLILKMIIILNHVLDINHGNSKSIDDFDHFR